MPIRKYVLAAATLILCLTVVTQEAWGRGGKGARGGGKVHAGKGVTKHGGGGTAYGGQRTTTRGGGGTAYDGQQTTKQLGRGQRHGEHRTTRRQGAVENSRDAVRGRSDRTRFSERGSRVTDRAGQSVHNRDRYSTRDWGIDKQSSHPWSMQRANEERKLDHRLQVADRLDELAEKNPNLHDVAARKREKAWDHYEKRMAKINSKDPNYVPSDGSGLVGDGLGSPMDDVSSRDSPLGGDTPLADDLLPIADQIDGAGDAPGDDVGNAVESLGPPTDAESALTDAIGGTNDSVSDATDALSDVTSEFPDPSGTGPLSDPFTGRKLAGRENALYRQLRNEQRQLAKRMEMADRLWDAFEQTGDDRLADAARAFEDRALAQFEKRMDAISDFRQRHSLPDFDVVEPASTRTSVAR